MKEISHSTVIPEINLVPLRFGSDNEFEYQGCVEELDPSDKSVEEVTILFNEGERMYGLTIERSDQDSFRTEIDPEGLPPAIETQFIDPQIIVNVLRLPSGSLRELSVEFTQE